MASERNCSGCARNPPRLLAFDQKLPKGMLLSGFGGTYRLPTLPMARDRPRE